MVWVSEDEKNLLEAKAKFYGYKTFAAYIRDAAVFELILMERKRYMMLIQKIQKS